VITNIGPSGISGYPERILLPAEKSALAPSADALDGASPLTRSDGPGLLGQTAAAQGSTFSNFIDRAVQEVDGKMKAAAADQTKVLTGETNNLHQAMISMQEASLAFSLMVEVRNKLVESYQELMRMPGVRPLPFSRNPVR